MSLKVTPLLLLAVGLVGGVLLMRHIASSTFGGRESLAIPESVEITVDTLRYEDVEPVSVEPNGMDSLYTFRDSVDGRWSAEVSGENVELRSLVLVDRVEHRTTTRLEEPEWLVALKGGLSPHSQWVGVGVTRNFGRLGVTLDGGYDMWREEPYVGASASFTLWRE